MSSLPMGPVLKLLLDSEAEVPLPLELELELELEPELGLEAMPELLPPPTAPLVPWEGSKRKLPIPLLEGNVPKVH